MGKVIDEEDFKFVKNSIQNFNSKDKEFCEDLVDYIDSSSSNNDDEFFYDMMIAIRFVNEPGVIAYTKEDKRIFLSAPGMIGDKLLPWDFTYDHECLHQLWESFAVADEIKKKGIKYDHDLFNIASDVVINDYLRDIRGKTPPNGIYFPEDIEKKFGVTYDRRRDTQFTLYQKLLATGKSAPSDMKNSTSSAQSGKGQGQPGQQGQSSGQSGKGGQQGQSGGQSSGGNGEQHKDIDKMSKDEAKASAQADAQRAQEAADRAKDKYGAGSDEAKKAQDAADKAKEAAGKAKRARSENGARKAAKEAENAANEAERAAGKDDKDQNGPGDPNAWGSGNYEGGKNAEDDLTDLEKKEISKITKDIEDIVKKARTRISGAFGDFVRQCKFSGEMRESGLAMPVRQGKSNWRQLTYHAADKFIKNLVFKKKREWKASYQRLKRGSGIVKFGEPIEMGRVPREDKIDIPVCFYIDKSGSMNSTINKASQAMYGIAEDVKKAWFKEKIINELDFEFYAFDTRMHKLRLGQVPDANHDNMSLADILGFMANKEKKDLVNIIITDGQYPINDSEMAKWFKNYDGLMIIVINNVNSAMKDLEKKFPGKFVYVQADHEFSL